MMFKMKFQQKNEWAWVRIPAFWQLRLLRIWRSLLELIVVGNQALLEIGAWFITSKKSSEQIQEVFRKYRCNSHLECLDGVVIPGWENFLGWLWRWQLAASLRLRASVHVLRPGSRIPWASGRWHREARPSWRPQQLFPRWH